MQSDERERLAEELEAVADEPWDLIDKDITNLRRAAALLREPREAPAAELEEVQRKLAHMIVYAQQLEARVEAPAAEPERLLLEHKLFGLAGELRELIPVVRPWVRQALLEDIHGALVDAGKFVARAAVAAPADERIEPDFWIQEQPSGQLYAFKADGGEGDEIIFAHRGKAALWPVAVLHAPVARPGATPGVRRPERDASQQ